jgi:putative aldouronate transport system substrate-binding protein
MTIAWIGHPHVLSEPAPEDGNYAELLIEERFGVDIEVVPMNISDGEKFMLFFAEGNSADHINVFGSGQFQTLADQGLIRTIEADWLYQYMPDWMQNVADFFGKDMMEAGMTYNGEVWGAPYLNYGRKNPYFPVARADWLAAVGITSLPDTLAEFEDMIRKFTEEDPDGNGANDTYGIHDSGLNFPSIFGAFGIQNNTYYEKNGRIVSSLVMEEYREVLRLLSRWYAEGWIDPEVVTDNRTAERNKWSEGKVGVIHDHPWWMADSTPSNILAIVKDKNPNATFALLPAPVGPNGLSGSNVGYPDYVGQGAVYFGFETDEAKVKKIMEIKNALYGDHDLYNSTYHGKEGTHWNFVNGIITYKPEIAAPQRNADGLGQFYALAPVALKDLTDFIGPADMKFYEHSITFNPIFKGGAAFPTAGASEAMKVKGGDVNTVAGEFYWQAITGKANLESDWDAYVTQLKRVGLD